MNCEHCRSGVYELMGHVDIAASGHVSFNSTFEVTTQEGLAVHCCSLCGNVKITDYDGLLKTFRKAVREAAYDSLILKGEKI